MQEFRIENIALKREARVRMVSWGTVLLLVAIATLLLILRASGHIRDDPTLGTLFEVTILSAAIIAIVLAPREGLHRAERKMVFALDEKRIVRKRQGYPDVAIAFSEVATLREELRWLVITSTKPRRKIAVPKSVSGYELIRGELAKHHPLSAPATFPVKSVLLPAVSILSWAVVLWLRDLRLALPAGFIGFITLAVESRHLQVVLRSSSRRSLVWISLGSAWLAAFLLIYLRIVRPLMSGGWPLR